MTGAPVPGSLANIGPRGAARRRTAAIVLVVITIAAVGVLDRLGAPLPWRALGFLTLWAAALCWLQAAAKT